VGQPGARLPDEFDVVTATPIDYFFLLFKPFMFADVVRHTNSYAQWSMDQAGRDDPRWTDTTEAEMRAYIGMHINMGINPLPATHMYWSSNPNIGNEGMKRTMTANRFQKLTQYIHVADRASEPAKDAPDFDALYKLRPVIDHVSATFQEMYTPSEFVSVDEAMIPYTGRKKIKQFMNNKPVKKGIKVWMCCDSTNAYCHKFDVYLGKQARTEHGLGYRVVKDMTSELRGSNRQVFFDNFFTSVQLVESLQQEDSLYSCGTVRTNRIGFPAELKKPRDLRQRGQMRVLQKGDTPLVASVWKDCSYVHTLSTLPDSTKVVPGQRQRGAEVVPVEMPHPVAQYNRYMGGVDLHDQYRMCYEVGRNSHKWWKYLFFFMLNCCVVNSFLLYKAVSRRRTSKKRYAHLDYREELVSELIAGYTSRKRPSSAMKPKRVGNENVPAHSLERLPWKKRRCVQCVSRGERKESVFGCAMCGVNLCKKGCHAQFHSGIGIDV